MDESNRRSIKESCIGADKDNYILYSYRTERSMVAVGSFILLVASFPSILFASEKRTNVRQLHKTCTVLQYVLQ